MLPLLALNGVFSLVVLGPAGVIYGTMVGFTPLGVAAFVLCCLGLILLSQSLCCLLGWLLHLLLGRINKSLASAIYMVLFLGLYFYLYSQAGNILNAMAAGGASMASTLRSWVWPLYAMGQASMGNLTHLAAFLGIWRRGHRVWLTGSSPSPSWAPPPCSAPGGGRKWITGVCGPVLWSTL